MTAHLTDVELGDFAAGTLGPEDLLRADDHLAHCDRCRRRAVAVSGAARQIDDVHVQLIGPATHLSDEELQLFIEGRLPSNVKETVRQHLENCATCVAQVNDLRVWAAPTAPRARWSYLAVAAVVAVSVLIPAAMRQWRSLRPAPSPSLAGLETLPGAEQMRVRAALDGGVAALPEFVTDFSSSREVLMGSPAKRGETFDLVAPVDTASVSDQPRFEWQAVEGADGYVVTVFDERSNVVARSSVLAQTKWTSAESLARDRTYVWQVTAHRGRDMITAPVAPSPPAKFHVIDARSAEVLEQTEAEHPQAHLLLGILNMNAGIRDAAVRHLQQVQPTDARVDVARRSLERLKALTEPARMR